MNDISNWLVQDHQRYETALDKCEITAGAGDWKNAIQMYYGFVNDLKLHMRIEEEVLYPIFVEETGDPEDEIAELRDDHNYMVHLTNDLAHIIRTKDIDHFEDSLIPVKKAMARHYRHEEAVLQRIERRITRAYSKNLAQRLPSLAVTAREHNQLDSQTSDFLGSD